MFALENFNMIMEPAFAIKREVVQLIDLQIATLRQRSSPTAGPHAMRKDSHSVSAKASYWGIWL